MRLIPLELWVLTFFVLATAVAHADGGGGVPGGGGIRGSSGPDPNKAYQEGVQLLEAGECKKADRKFRIVLKAVFRSPEANLLRGTALRCQGKHKNAAKYFRRAIKYNASMYSAYHLLGLTYLDLDELEDAKQELERLSALREGCSDECSPKLMRAHEKLNAAIQGRIRDGKQAMGPEGDGRQHSLLFERTSEPRAVYLRAIEWINGGDFEIAIAELRKLSATIGPVPDVLNYLGYAHRRLGRFEESLSYYEQALALDPMHRGANEYLGELFVELGRIEQAEGRLVVLDRACPFGCAEYEDLKRRIESRVVASH